MSPYAVKEPSCGALLHLQKKKPVFTGPHRMFMNATDSRMSSMPSAVRFVIRSCQMPMPSNVITITVSTLYIG